MLQTNVENSLNQLHLEKDICINFNFLKSQFTIPPWIVRKKRFVNQFRKYNAGYKRNDSKTVYKKEPVLFDLNTIQQLFESGFYIENCTVQPMDFQIYNIQNEGYKLQMKITKKGRTFQYQQQAHLYLKKLLAESWSLTLYSRPNVDLLNLYKIYSEDGMNPCNLTFTNNRWITSSFR